MTTEQTTRRLVIDRATWRWGGDDLDSKFGDTQLINKAGFKCCLGFDALACGISSKSINEVYEPCYVTRKSVWRDKLKKDSGRTWAYEAMELNDNGGISNAGREVNLIEHFKYHPMGPVELVFEGEYPEGAL